MARVEIEIPPRSPYVGVVRLALASLSRGAGLDEESLDDLKIAISEACTNAVLGHEETGSGDPVVVSWDDLGDRIVIEVTDKIVSKPDVRLEDSQGFSTRQVMSRALLESLAQSLEVDSSPSGTTTRLTFSR